MKRKKTLVDRDKEQFRILVNQLKDYKNQGKSCLAFVSTTVGQGKTHIIEETAKILARGGEKVLVIDANIVVPTLTIRANKIDEAGWIEGLEKIEQETEQEITSLVMDYIKELEENLYLLPLGKAKCIEEGRGISEEGLKKVLNSLRGAFEYILVEVPSFEWLSYTQILTKAMDGCLFIVKAGVVKKEDISYINGILDSLGCEILSSILNKKEEITYSLPKKRKKRTNFISKIMEQILLLEEGEVG